MDKLDYSIETYDSEKEFLNVVKRRKIKLYGDVEDTNNSFQILTVGKYNFEIGVIYYSFGLGLQVVFYSDILILGFERNLICINTRTDDTVYEKKILSFIWEFLLVKYYLVIVCDLEIHVLTLAGKYVWSVGFRDVIEDYDIMDERTIQIKCSDTREYYYDIATGEYVD